MTKMYQKLLILNKKKSYNISLNNNKTFIDNIIIACNSDKSKLNLL